MIVGISGKQFSGKTTLANQLAKKTNGRIIRVSFADKLKQTASMLTGIPVASMQEHKNKMIKGWNMTLGQFLQWFGTDVCRNQYENVWVDMSIADLSPDCDYVFDDVRFKNEAEAISDSGGVIIRVNGDPSSKREASTRSQEHPSETDLDDFLWFDLVLDSESLSIDQMGEKAYDFLKNKFINRKFSMVKDKQQEFKVLKENFSKVFGSAIAGSIKTEDDLYNKRAIDIIKERLEFINANDPDLEYTLRTGSVSDIHPEVSEDELTSLRIDSIDGNKN